MSELIDGLGTNGKFMVIGADFQPIEVTPLQLIGGTRTIQGWSTGTAIDAEDTLRFAELTGVRPMIETYPLEKAAEAYSRMMSGDAQFRVVLTMVPSSPFPRLHLKAMPMVRHTRTRVLTRRNSPASICTVLSLAASDTTCLRKLRRSLRIQS